MLSKLELDASSRSARHRDHTIFEVVSRELAQRTAVADNMQDWLHERNECDGLLFTWGDQTIPQQVNRGPLALPYRVGTSSSRCRSIRLGVCLTFHRKYQR